MASRLSVIIPALNEADWIAHSVARARSEPDAQVLVVDGGSDDDTVALARAAGADVLDAPRGRARQMNHGAWAATGEVLLFLHADTLLPPDYGQVIQRTLTPPEVSAGAFRLRLTPRGPGLRFVERAANWRARRLGLPYGDQALFMRAQTFREIGGYADLPVMEDYELVRRLGRRGRVVLADAAVTTSTRRWRRHGVWRTVLAHQAIIAGYHLGVPPQRLARWR